MSGGSYNYIYCKLLDECGGRMYDMEMNDMVHDLVGVLRSLEWWQSGDSSEDEYRKAVADFKKKWFQGDRCERLKGYIDTEIENTRNRLLELVGEDGE